MKKKRSLVLALALTLALTACGGQTDPPAGSNTPPAGASPDTPPAGASADSGPSENTGTPDTIPSLTGDGGILIAYFGVPETDGTDTVANASRVATEDGVVGNCQFIAQAIQQAVGGDLFAIGTVQDYPGTHQPLLDFAYDELRRDARPELSGEIENLDEYDVIFVGYPIWWDEAPAMIAAFLAENDFSGKVVAPFCTSSYSPIDNSLHIFRELASGAAITEGLTANSESSIRPWVDQVMSQAGESGRCKRNTSYL